MQASINEFTDTVRIESATTFCLLCAERIVERRRIGKIIWKNLCVIVVIVIVVVVIVVASITAQKLKLTLPGAAHSGRSTQL